MNQRVGAQRLHELDGDRGAATSAVGHRKMLRPDAEHRPARAPHQGCILRVDQRGAAVLRKDRLLAAPFHRKEIHRRRADEPGDELVRRPLIDGFRRVVLLHHAVLQHHDAISHGHGLDLVMGDEDHGGLQLLRQRLDLGAHLPAQFCVEVGERLIEQEGFWIAHDSAPHRHALTLATGQFLRLAVEIRIDMQQRGRALYALVDLGLGHTAQFQRERHVVVDAHVRIERVVLKHHRDVALRRRNAVDAPIPDEELAGRDRLETCDDPQQRRLPAAGRADENNELMVRDLEIEIGDHGQVAVSLDQVADGNGGHDR